MGRYDEISNLEYGHVLKMWKLPAPVIERGCMETIRRRVLSLPIS